MQFNTLLARVKEKTSYEVDKCGSNFDYDQATIERLGIDDYYCPVQKNYSIIGTYYSPVFRYLELKIYKQVLHCLTYGRCETGCAANMDAVLNKAVVNFAFVNSYFDFEDFDIPVK